MRKKKKIRRQKRPRGRPRHVPTETTRSHVEGMAAYGVPEVQIAAIIGVTAPTLRLHYRTELDLGLDKANMAVANNLYRQATKDDVRSFNAAKFWLNCRAGWSEFSPAKAPPPAPKPEKLGKKAKANIDAQTAEVGTTWDEVLPKPGESIQ